MTCMNALIKNIAFIPVMKINYKIEIRHKCIRKCEK
jgi:hypothetical protein